MTQDYRFGLSKKIFYNIISVLSKYASDIESAYLFGSRARGDYKNTSDIDIAIQFRNDTDLVYKIKDDLTQEKIIYTLDIINLNKVTNENVKYAIKNEGQIIFLTDNRGQVTWNMNKFKYKLIDLEKAYKKLQEILLRDHTEDDIVVDATIQRFEITYELSWKVMKAYLEFHGNLEATNPRSAIKEAFNERLIDQGDAWLKMLEDRNRTSHTYDEETALEIYLNIKKEHAKLFGKFINKLKELIVKD